MYAATNKGMMNIDTHGTITALWLGSLLTIFIQLIIQGDQTW